MAKTKPPYDFVLDELGNLNPYTKLMFGTTAVYVGDKIIFVLREFATKYVVDSTSN